MSDARHIDVSTLEDRKDVLLAEMRALDRSLYKRYRMMRFIEFWVLVIAFFSGGFGLVWYSATVLEWREAPGGFFIGAPLALLAVRYIITLVSFSSHAILNNFESQRIRRRMGVTG